MLLGMGSCASRTDPARGQIQPQLVSCQPSGATEGYWEKCYSPLSLQLLGLATPLTQVIIDKVMVQESLPTLDVMAIALLGVAVFEAFLGILRLFIFTHTPSP